jgi:stage II sporulation protein M
MSAMLSRFMQTGRVIRQNRNWLFLALIIFLLSGFFFFIVTDPVRAPLGPMVDEQFEQLQNLFTLILESSPLIGVLIVFINNFISMAQMLILGFLAGVSPLFTLGLNGALIGIMFALAAGEGIPLLPLLILGILPHGVFELSAFFLCGALGLKFGYHCVVSPLPGKSRLESFKHIWKETISVLPLVVVLLLLAALVEILITPKLLGLILEVPF